MICKFMPEWSFEMLYSMIYYEWFPPQENILLFYF